MTSSQAPAIPPLSQLYVYLTGACNLRCRHCWIQPRFTPSAPADQALKVDVLSSILDEALPLGLQTVKLTGGEPLIHPNLPSILDAIRQRNLGLIIETNGIALSAATAAMLAAFNAPSISVSLDSPDADVHDDIRGVPGAFRAAVSGIRHLVSAGLRPQIIMTLMRRNAHQVEAMVRLAEAVGAGSVKFNIMQPTARGEQMHAAGEALSIEELLALGRMVEQDLAQTTALMLCFHQPPAFRALGRMFGSDGDGCFSCALFGILGVLCDGTYALCGIGVTVPELIFGSAGRDALKDVWEKTPVLQEIRSGMPRRLEGICGRCAMKYRCLGGCIAQNYYAARNLWAPFWFCEEADRKGLFPESRKIP